VKALIHTGRENGVELRVLQAVEDANERQKHVLVDKIVARFGEDLPAAPSPSGAWPSSPTPTTCAKPPAASSWPSWRAAARRCRPTTRWPMRRSPRVLAGTPGLSFADSQDAALEGADALVVVTEWKEFRNPDFDAIKATLKQPLVFDGRNLYEPALMQ
jgi:UDPglucose 6-dehydrogenase